MLKEVFIKYTSTDLPSFAFAALIPLLFLILMIKDKEAKVILSYFCWGIAAVNIAFFINTLMMYSSGAYRLSADIAPIIEETLKALPLLLFLCKKEAPAKLLIYSAMASGIGFSIGETVFYFASLNVSVDAAIVFLLIVRTLTTCLMHGMSTAIIGFGINFTSHIKQIRLPMTLGLWAIAIVVHSVFNVVIGTRFAVFALLMPALLYFCGLALIDSKHTGK